MIDRMTMICLLTVLREQRDIKPGTEESALFDEVNLRASAPLTSGVLREHVQLAEDKGWIEPKTGSLRERRWRMTATGVGGLEDLREGR
jgi:hypothetical protein